jgi:hypothetical protein
MSIHINTKSPLASSLNWEIKETPIFHANGQQVRGYKSLINDSTNEVINVAKDSYKPVRNERLQELTERFTQNTNFKIEGFATYKNGNKVMAYLRNDNPPNFAGQKAQDFLIIGNSHDGSTAFFTGLTNYIYRCENMFSQGNQHSRIRHSAGAEQELRAIEKTHDLYYNQLTGVYERAEQMSEYKTCYAELENFTNYVLNINPNEREEDLPTRTRNTKENFLQSVNRETAALGHNLFGLFNGATHYTSHVLTNQKNVFGNPLNLANTINSRAFDFCEKIIINRPTMVQVLKPEPLKIEIAAPQMEKEAALW